MNSTLKQFRLLRYARPHWSGLAVVLVTMLISVGLSLASPWPMKLLIDQILNGQPVPPDFGKAQQSFAHGAGVTDLTFGPDNASLYSASLDKSVRAWRFRRSRS